MTARAPTTAIEQTIASLLEAGDAEGALRAVIEGYGDELKRFVQSILRDEQVAQEVFVLVQEDLWRGLPTFRGEASLRTWAYVVAQRACFRHRSRAGNRRDVGLSEASPSRLVAPTQTSRLEKEARHELLARLRDELPEEDRVLLLLRVDRGLSWEDVARILAAGAEPDVTVATLRKRFERVKARLRSKLREHDDG